MKENFWKHVHQTNVERYKEWHRDSNWGRDEWLLALRGEIGELCNVGKKLNRRAVAARGNKPTDTILELEKQLCDELADVYLYLSILLHLDDINSPNITCCTAIDSTYLGTLTAQLNRLYNLGAGSLFSHQNKQQIFDCLHSIALSQKVSLQWAVAEKFNRTSRELGFSQQIEIEIEIEL